MLRRKKFLAKVLILALFFGFLIYNRPGEVTFKPAKAGDITNPTWTLSSQTESAADVIYTLTFTTETAVPACNAPGNCGNIEISLGGPPTQAFPDFSSSRVTVSSGGTTYVDDRAFESWEIMSGQGWTSINVRSGDTAIPVGEITVAITGVTNPSTGGSIMANVLTTNNGMELDGRRNSNNSTIAIGSESMRGRILSAATGEGIASLRVEVHSMYAGGGFWQTTTNSTGNYSFRGITAGEYIFEISPGGDMNNRELNQYMRFDPMNITITSGQTLEIPDVSLSVSSKIISGTVKYADNSGTVRGAMVNAFSMGKGGSAFAQTDANGAFTLRVGGGLDFFVMIMPSFGPPPGEGNPGNQPATDFFPQQPKQVSFLQAADAAETVNMGDVLVEKTDATVTGKLVASDGSAVNGGGMGLSNYMSHLNIPVMLQQDGQFTVKAKSGKGKWRLERFDPMATNAMPETEFTIRPGANDLGTITMIPLDKTITVTATRNDTGAAVANIPVMAFRSKNPGPPFMAFTDSTGVAIIKVMAGFEGRVMANPGGEGGPGKRGPEGPKQDQGPMGKFIELVKHVMAQEQGPGPVNASQLYPVTPPQKVRAGDSVTMQFALADKQVNVSTIKQGTTELMTDGGFVEAVPTGSGLDAMGKGFGGPTAGGQGTINTTAGAFKFRAFFPPESDWLGIPESATITSSGQNVAIETVQKTVTITGSVLDASNNDAVIKDASLNIMIGVFGDAGFGMGKYDPATGTYTARFAPGMKFRIGVAAGDPGMGIQNGGYVPNITPIELQGTDGQTITQNVSLAKVDAIITGTVTDQNNAPVEGVTVFADPGLADIVGPEGGHGPGPGGPEDGPEFGFSGMTDENGVYSINVAPNTYNLIVNAKDLGLFATSTTHVEIASQETESANISLARADSTIRIEVNNQDGSNLQDAEVQIFNDKGTIAFSTEVDDEGIVEIDIPADTYTIKAGKDSEDGTVEESEFIKVVAAKDQTANETLQTATETGVLPSPVTMEVDSTSPANISLQKGGTEIASLNIPGGTLTSSSSMGSSGGEEGGNTGATGNPIVTVSPLDAQAVATKVDIPLVGYNVEAIDSNGNEISSLAGLCVGKIAYRDADIPFGVAEANLTVKSFNENSGQWEAIASSSVDTETNTVTFATTHFSDFAIVATADTNAPAAPTNIAASGGDQKVTLSWTNPTDSDFAGIKVYRSTTSGSVGDLVTTISNTTTTSYENTGLTNGTTYYYVVRSYDTSGNISTNATQVSASPGVLPATGNESALGRFWIKLVNLASNLF